MRDPLSISTVGLLSGDLWNPLEAWVGRGHA
ncbi:MAG: hypothetical protein ACI9K5_000353 [Gammaproteobacteria bacterium]|jgi:hypothetical protein